MASLGWLRLFEPLTCRASLRFLRCSPLESSSGMSKNSPVDNVRSRVSDAHVYADDLTGWFMRDVGSRIGEAYKPSPGSVFGDSGRRSRRDILPRTSHTKLHPAACGNEDLAPLAVEPSNGQVPYGKAFVDVLLVPG